jgi:hypothetical protein
MEADSGGSQSPPKAVELDGKIRRRFEVKYNRDRNPCPFGVGDLVLLRTHPVSRAGAQITAKLSPRWRGPFKIQNFLTPVTVELVHPESGHYVSRAYLSQVKGAYVN